MEKRRLVFACLALTLAIVGAEWAAIRFMDDPPLLRWRKERLIARQAALLRSGNDHERMWAANRLGPLGLEGSETARAALTAALSDPDPTVAANARLSLRFFLHEPLEVDRRTYELASKTPRDPAFVRFHH